VEVGPGPAGSVVWIGVEMPEAPHGRLSRVDGGQRDGGGGRGGVAAARYVASLATRYGSLHTRQSGLTLAT
jgi:hypothetical protein